jgi:carbon storage regulator CsrA
MLVLSRGENDRIVFPSLGISVEVLKVKGSRASIGIDAPKSIRVIRHELLDESDALGAPAAADDEEMRRIRHEFRNHINRATLKLQLAAKLFARGDVEQGLAKMSSGIADLSTISDAGGDAATRPSDDLPTSLAEAKATFQVDATVPSRRVLLVDDDANERTLMASYLKSCGLAVDQASDGLKALYALSQRDKPDVVLLDMNMPNLGGRETVRRIRTCSSMPKIPVFAVTGESFEHAGLDIGEDGVTGWFQKPVQVEEIVDCIRQCETV